MRQVARKHGVKLKPVVMRLTGLVTGGPCPLDGTYLAHFDPDKPGVDASGEPMLCTIETTNDPRRAKRFADLVELRNEWARVSTVEPVRPDGKPNRYLTAFTIEVEEAPAVHLPPERPTGPSGPVTVYPGNA